VGVILGSGLGRVAGDYDADASFCYSDIPGFPEPTVPGHSGRLLFCRIAGRTCALMAGRFHLYEGYDWGEVTLPVRVMKLLGASRLIVTNSAGAINRRFRPGDLMVICDHIALLLGRFSMTVRNIPRGTELYSRDLVERAIEAASALGICLREGILATFPGPSYETPAELEMARRMGADAVTMSTVPEVIAAREEGMEVIGISCISNLTWHEEGFDHAEVIDMAGRSSARLSMLLRELIGRLG